MNISDYAGLGIDFALLAALVYVVKLNMDFMKNHIQHATDSQDKLSQAIHSMLEFLRNNK